MPYEEPYPEEEFIKDSTPIGKYVAKELPPAFEEPSPRPHKRSC